MGTGSDGAGDLGEVGVHCRRVDGWQDEPRRGAASRADRAKQTGPLVSRVAGRAGSGAAPGPDAGQGALLADPRFVPCIRGGRLRNRISSGLPRACPGIAMLSHEVV
jgi:hypothetical protein